MAPRVNGKGSLATNGSAKMNERNHEEELLQPYRVMVSARFVVTSLLASMLLAYSVGSAARLLLLPHGTTHDKLLSLRDRPGYYEGYARPLPALTVKEGKKQPKTRYTGRNFDSTMSVSNSAWLNTERDANNLGGGDARQCHQKQHGGQECSNDEQDEVEEDDDEDEEDVPNPSGEHLMVDFKHVSAEFLNSEHRLAQAMVDLVNAADLTLLSYHCHGLTPAGVSCVGVLLQGYVSFHTWPVEGVITFDLCVGGNTPIISAVPTIQQLFGVPRTATMPNEAMARPEMRWAHKLRGFRFHPDDTSIFSGTDLGNYIVGDMSAIYKKEIASIETDFQRIDIYDSIEKEEEYEMHLKSLANDGSYFSRHSLSFRPDRIVLLDGWLQSSLKDEVAYHEALVHPALFAHEAPKRVAIIGGGEAATLREVLKHNTVEEAVMIEIDEKMTSASRDYLPEWSDCSDFGAAWCVDDPRSTMYYEDALAWFMDRYSDINATKAEPLDIIIMDALDPESDIPFAKMLYSNDAVMQAFFDSLSKDGLLVMQLGESPSSKAAAEANTAAKNRAATTDLLTRVGFESIHTYEESHCGFQAPWMFVVAFKSYKTRERWYSNTAKIEIEIAGRRVKTNSGENPFKYFDGPTMVSYQVPPKAMEIVYCRQVPIPKECEAGEYTYDLEAPNFPLDSFEVKMSGGGENAGRGVFAKVDIPRDAYLSAETSCHQVHFMPPTLELIEAMNNETYAEINSRIVPVEAYMHGYGCTSRSFGEREVFVDSGALTFVNHGCNGTYNIGQETDFDESTVNLDALPDIVSGKNSAKYSPMIERHLFHSPVHALRDIKAGEEILDNYLAFTSEEESWKQDVTDLRELCTGAPGDVTNYERNHTN
jgi:spermidine synthase